MVFGDEQVRAPERSDHHVARLDQLDQLATVAALPSVSVQVIPFRTRVPVGPLNVFVVYDDRLVRVESKTGLLAFTRPRRGARLPRAVHALPPLRPDG